MTKLPKITKDEAEVLEHFLDSARHKMAKAYNVWEFRTYMETCGDMFSMFLDLKTGYEYPLS